MSETEPMAAETANESSFGGQEPVPSWHTKPVSYGGVILMAIGMIFAIDASVAALTGWLALEISGFDPISGIVAITSARILGIIVFIMVLWIGFLGKPLYEKRPGRIVNVVLKASIVYFLIVAVNIGLAALAVFFLFLFTPRQSDQWTDEELIRYRGLITSVIVIWMALEMFLTEDVIGINVLPSILTRSVAGSLLPFGANWIAISAVFIVIPLYVMLPKALKMVWDMKKSIGSFWSEFVRHRMGMVGFILIAAIVLLAFLAPIIAPYHWSYITTEMPETWSQPPSWEHILGTNHEGGDIFSRIIWGAQISLLVGFIASIIAVLVGTSVGLVSGYFGGATDSILMRITDVVLCLPTLPLMLIFLALFGQGLQNIIIVIAILSWTGTARMVRSEALSLRERPLTEAAHAIGASDTYILLHHILPNTLPLILANVVLGVVAAILSEAGIAFLGFVNIHDQPSWGIILHWAEKKAALSNGMWWWIIPPGLMIMLTTLGFVFVSHAADKVVNPRLRGRR